MKNFVFASIVTAAFAGLGCGAFGQPTTGDLFIEGVKILAKNDIRISAEADGVINELPVREGSAVDEGALLAAVDDRQAKAAVDVAHAEVDAARTRANDKIEELYAKKAFDVALVDWQKDKEANAQVANAVPDIQIRQKKLVVQKSDLQIQKAKIDQTIAGKDADVKEGQLRAAEVNLDQRRIKALFKGEVQQVFRHRGEWVRAGDPIMGLVQFDVLLVDSFVKASEYNPGDVAGRPVSVTATLARGAEQSLTGRIVYVEQTVADNGEFRVRAELTNRRDDAGFWVLRPGLRAKMTIHTSQPPIEATTAGP